MIPRSTQPPRSWPASVNGRDEPRDIDEAPEGTHDFDIDIPDGCRIALEVTAPTIRTSAASTKLGSGTIGRGRGLRTTGGWSSGMRPEGPQVRMVKVMNRIVPTLLVNTARYWLPV